MTIVEQIKAEIERLKEKAERRPHATPLEGFECMGKIKVCNELLSFLSTLESEKPMNPEELEKEIEEYFPESTFNTGFNYDDLQEIARHFAKWGAEHLVDNHKMTRDVKDIAAEKAREYTLSLPGGERTTAIGSTYSESGYYHGFIDGFKFKSNEKKFH